MYIYVELYLNYNISYFTKYCCIWSSKISFAIYSSLVELLLFITVIEKVRILQHNDEISSIMIIFYGNQNRIIIGKKQK